MPGVCHYFLQGYCARGNQCKYAHLMNPHVAFPLENDHREHLIEKRYSEQVSELIAPHGTFGLKPIARCLTHPSKTGHKLGIHEGSFKLIARISILVQQLQNAQVSDFTGQLFFLCKDQQGCRFLQKKLDEGNANDARAIFEEVQNHFGELMVGMFQHSKRHKLMVQIHSEIIFVKSFWNIVMMSKRRVLSSACLVIWSIFASTPMVRELLKSYAKQWQIRLWLEQSLRVSKEMSSF